MWRQFLPSIIKWVPTQIRGPLAKILPIAAARKMKAHPDAVARKSQEVFEAKKLSMQQGDEGVTAQIGHGKDIMSILSK